MNRLNFIGNSGLKVTWKLIDIGLHGEDEIPALLMRDEITEYLKSSINSINEQTDNAVALICEGDNPAEFDKLLKRLSREENSNGAIQKRKWRICLLKELLDGIGEDYFQGLLAITEFWSQMGKLENSLDIFPKNKDALQNYFTLSTFKSVMDKNISWLKEEISIIAESEN